MESEAEQRWLCDKHQEVKHQALEASVKRSLALEMLKSQTFDNFLATKFQSVKRYGGEGAEAMMGFFTQLFHQAQADNIEDIIIAEVYPEISRRTFVIFCYIYIFLIFSHFCITGSPRAAKHPDGAAGLSTRGHVPQNERAARVPAGAGGRRGRVVPPDGQPGHWAVSRDHAAQPLTLGGGQPCGCGQDEGPAHVTSQGRVRGLGRPEVTSDNLQAWVVI